MKLKLTLLITLVFLAFTGTSQTIKYKKDVKPFIEQEKYDAQGFINAKAFHSANVNPDNSLTDKAALIQYDNMFSTRLYLAFCYQYLAYDQASTIMLDSAMTFANLALDLYKDNATTLNLVESLKLSKKEIEVFIKQQEKEAYNEKYGLKKSIVHFQGGEFIGHCRVTFKTKEGEEIIVINPDLAPFDSDNECMLLEDAINKEFVIEYQLEKATFYTEDVGSQTDEVFVLKSIRFEDVNEQNKFLDEQKQKKDKENTDELLAIIQNHGGIPERHKFDCDNCNERVLKGLDVCDKSEVMDALIHIYWYDTYMPGGGKANKIGAEYVFFPDGKLLIYKDSDEYSIVDYTIEFCQSTLMNGKTVKAAVVKYQIEMQYVGLIEQVLNIYEYDASMLGALRAGMKEQSLLEKVIK